MKKSNVFLQRTLFTEDTRAIGAFEYDVIIEPCFVMRFLVHMETSTSRKISPTQCAQLHDIFIPVIKVRIVYKKKASLLIKTLLWYLMSVSSHFGNFVFGYKVTKIWDELGIRTTKLFILLFYHGSNMKPVSILIF